MKILTAQMTMEEVEVVFGTGAGQGVKAALGERHPACVQPHTP